jgi:hypothetical protein
MLWLLMRKFFDIRPVRAAGIVFSFLLLAMGAVFLANRFEANRTTALEEARARQAETVREALSETQILLQGFTGEPGGEGEAGTETKSSLADASPGHAMLRLKDRLMAMVAGTSGETPAPPAIPTSEAVAVAAVPTALPTAILPTPMPIAAATLPQATTETLALPAGALSGSDLEQLLVPTTPSASSQTTASADDAGFLEGTAQAPLPGIRIRDERTGQDTPVQDERRGVTAEQLQQMVSIRNRSTDPRYPAPSYAITATGKGSRGSYVIANGQLVGLGSTVDNPGGEPKAWKLREVNPTSILWTPVP